ncbi:MAG TPA: hypothetical protein P5164_16130, partial [Thermoanaerobaculia bacterium]|nr:hypothetical protein [Thermoanaerobaculia bacterium]
MASAAPDAFLPNPPSPGLGGSPRVGALLERAAAGGRLTSSEAVLLLEEAPLLELGAAAAAVRQRLHPGA